MLIYFCEKCGLRVPEKEVTSGAARVIEEVRCVCAKCAGGRPSGRASAQAASSTAELSLRRDSRTGVAPARGSGQHPSPPAARTSGLHATPQAARASGLHTAPPAARSAKASPSAALHPPPQADSSKMLLYIGAGVGVVVLVLVLALVLSGSNPPPKQAARKPDDASSPAKSVRPPAYTSTSPTTTPGGTSAGTAGRTNVPDEPPSLPPPPTDTKAADYDPRAAVAEALLTRAKGLATSDPWGCRDQLEELTTRYARTPSAEEAAKLLAEWKVPPQAAPPGQDKPRLDGSADTYLTLKDALSWRCGYSGKAQDGRSMEGNPLRLGNKTFERGIGSHAWGELSYDLGGHYQWLTGYLGVDSETNGKGSVGYEVWLDGKKAHDSGALRGGQEAQYFKVSVKGVHRVKIVVTNGGDNEDFDHADLCNLRVCAGEKEPAEDYGAAAAATTSTPATAEPAKPADPELAAQAAYAQFLAGLQAVLSQKGWALARARLDEALKDPQLASRAETLKLDGELLALTEKAWQAIPKGAAALADGRRFVLLQMDGKKFEVGKGTKTAVKKAEAETVQIEQDIGGGAVTLTVPFSKLTPETLFELARTGLPDDGEGKLALALMRLPAAQAGGRGKEAAEKDLRTLLEAAGKAGAPGGKVAALRAWLAFAEREQAAGQAFRQVEELIEAKKGEPAKAAWEAFRKEYSTTAFFAESGPKFAGLDERLRLVSFQPGLWCSYWKRDGGNNYAQKLFARAEKSVYINYDNERPAEVPKDNCSSLWSGVLRLEKDGRYTFRLDVDDEGRLWLDGRSIGQARFANDARSFEVDLTAGDHAITIEHQQGGGNSHVFVTWKPPGANDLQPVPLAVLWHLVEKVAEYERPPK